MIANNEAISFSGLTVGDVVTINKDLRPGSPASHQAGEYIGETPVSVTVFQNGKHHEVPFCYFNPNDIGGSLGVGVVHVTEYFKSDIHAGEPKSSDFQPESDEEDAREEAFNRYWDARNRYMAAHNVQYYYVNTMPLFRLPDGSFIHGGQCFWKRMGG